MSVGCWRNASWVARFHVTVLSVDVDGRFGLPVPPPATPNGIVAVTVPEVVMPVTSMVKTTGPPVTVATFVPPAVPDTVTSPVAKPTTGSLNTAVNVIGVTFVGSVWRTAWSIVTVGGVTSQSTMLSVEDEPRFGLPFASTATPGSIDAITDPVVVMPVTVTVYVVGPPVTTALRMPARESVSVTSPDVKPVTGSVKTAVNTIGLTFVGSGWPTAWLMVTLGGPVSQVTTLSVEVEADDGFPARPVVAPAPIVAITVPFVVMPDTETT